VSCGIGWYHGRRIAVARVGRRRDGEAVRNLSRDARFPPKLVQQLELLPGFRNVIVHEYVGLDMDRVVAAIRHLDPVERFAEIVRQMLRDTT
jgi:uncharacterized protein YutE (UPF0331/DUF86 family)